MTPAARRIFASVIATTGVVLIATLLPRGYFTNDDIEITEFLRENTLTPFVSPILSQALGFAYTKISGDLPWYGLTLYGLLISTGAMLIHVVTETGSRDRMAQIALVGGAVVLTLHHAIVVVSLTFTTVAISAIGTALASFISHVSACQRTGRSVSLGRASACGTLLLFGYILRPQGLAVAAVAFVPIFALAVWRFVHTRQILHLAAATALLGPLVAALLVQNAMPQSRDPSARAFYQFNNVRSKISGMTAYLDLDRRAPTLLEEAGWTPGELTDFQYWLFFDEERYNVKHLKRLLATGGISQPIHTSHTWQKILSHSAPSVLLFLTVVTGGLALALLERLRRESWLLTGYTIFMVAVPVLVSTRLRFPPQVALPMFSLAALNAFMVIVRGLAETPANVPRRPAAIACAFAVAVPLTAWAVHFVDWIGRDRAPDRIALLAFENRIAARNGFVLIYHPRLGMIDFDPLRPRPRAYHALRTGWGTFSVPWYRELARLEVTRGANLLPAMIDRTDAYLLTTANKKSLLEHYLRRRVDPRVRLIFVDAANSANPDRSELYRLITAQ